jgi:ATP-dependent DNA ligase
LDWFIGADNGIRLLHKVLMMEDVLVVGASGVGEKSFQRALGAIHIEATEQEIERRRQEVYGHGWPSAVASFQSDERGSITAAELMKTAEMLQGERSQRVRVNVLRSILERMGIIETYFFARMISKLRFYSSRAHAIVPVLARVFKRDEGELRRAAAMQTVAEVAEHLEHGWPFRTDILVPFKSFSPMLAAAWQPVNVFPVAVEAKYDGVRLILHKEGDRVGWFTRQRNDFSRIHEDLYPLGQSFSPYSVILDGEIIGTRMTPQGLQQSTVYELLSSLHQSTNEFMYSYVLFDIVYLNGQNLAKMPFVQRRALRTQIARQMAPFRFAVDVREPDFVDAYTWDDVDATYGRFRKVGYEGAIVKEMNAPYKFGERSPLWRKLVPREAYDVVITGVSLEEKDKAMQIRGFRCAVMDANHLRDVSYVVSLDREIGRTIMQMIVERGLFMGPGDIQTLDYTSKESDHWGYPVHPGIVVTIDAMGIVPDKDGALTFRSPRFRRIREDKPIGEITTYHDMIRGYESRT